MKCKCGEEVTGGMCMLCGVEVSDEGSVIESAGESAVKEHEVPTENTVPDAAERSPEGQPDAVNIHQEGQPNAGNSAAHGDATRRGSLGEYTLDIDGSVRIMDKSGNPIYDIPYHGLECSIRFGALRIRHPGGHVSLRGSDCRAWKRAISYQRSPPVWYLKGSEGCEVSYGRTIVGVTPCVVVPPFSWDAFRSGSYELRISRPGAASQKKTIRAISGIHAIRFTDGADAERVGVKPEGDTLVLNDERSLVLAEEPYLTDRHGVVVLRMPGASASIGMLKRGATIYWNEPGLGKLSVQVKCDSGLKYDRLREMLPAAKAQKADAPAAQPVNVGLRAAEHPAAEPARELPAEPKMGPDAAPSDTGIPEQKPKKKGGLFNWRRQKHKYNRGTYEGTDLCVTKDDLNSTLGRFNGYSFEAVIANLFAAMEHKIEKGYDVKSGKMLGPTKSDMGVDVLAVKKKERVIVQCKHWKGQCGGPDVNKTIGAASVHHGTLVVVVCTGGFTEQAYQIAKESNVPVELWDWPVIRKKIRNHLLK